MPVTTSLSGLSEIQLRDWLREVRRIAALHDSAALVEMDQLAFGLAAAVEHAEEEEVTTELRQRADDGRVRFRHDVQLAREHLQTPLAIGPWDAMHLRQWTDLFAETDVERADGRQLADALEAAYYGAQITRARTDPIASTASLGKQARLITQAVDELQRRGALTPAVEAEARAARERLARWRWESRLEVAAVAAAGGSLGKAARLRAEATVLLQQDWGRMFPGEPVPATGTAT